MNDKNEFLNILNKIHEETVNLKIIFILDKKEDLEVDDPNFIGTQHKYHELEIEPLKRKDAINFFIKQNVNDDFSQQKL